MEVVCAICLLEDIIPLWAPSLLSSAGNSVHVERMGCWTSWFPSRPAFCILPTPAMGCTQQTANVNVTGRERGRKWQE